MSEEVQRIPLSKKGQRQVTPFTGNELLFDYVSGVLDAERKNAVEAHVANSKEAQLDLQKIQNGLQYADKMKAITVSQSLQQRLQTPSTYLSVLFRKARFDQWPIGLKWGLEALVVVFVIVTVLSLAPWEKVLKLRLSGSNEVVLTEINKLPFADTAMEDAPKTAETPQFIDEGLKKEIPTATVATKPTSAKTTNVVKVDPAAGVAAVAVAPPIKAKTPPPPQPTAKVAVAAVSSATEEQDDATEETETSAAKPTGGFLYRGQLEVTNLEAVGPKIAEKITAIGGRKAGEVELGWQKSQGSAYFHFTIPEAKYDELKEFLGGYGKPRLNLEKHPRVMPDGIIRLIITVDEAKK